MRRAQVPVTHLLLAVRARLGDSDFLRFQRPAVYDAFVSQHRLDIMKRPLVKVALCYGGGLLLAEFLRPPVGLLFSSALVLAAGAVLLARARYYLIWPLVVLAGWTNLVWRTSIVSPYDLRLSQGNSAEIVTARGTLAETPSQRVYVHDDKEIWRYMAQLQVTQVLHHGTNWQPALGRVLALTPGISPAQFFAGQVVEVTGVLAVPPGPCAEGLFDYRAYLRRQGIYYQLKADSTNDWRLLSHERTPPLADRFLAWAQVTLARGLPGEDEPLRLLWAMTLGWKTGLTNEVYEPFMRSGTMHIFAISGLHIALIAGILVSVLRVMQLRRSWCGGIVIPVIWFYTAATGWQPSAVRSALMMSIVIGGWALERPSDLVNSLAAAAFIILLYDPQQLFGASFQLSFFVVLSIALLVPPLEKVRDRLMKTDPLLPAELASRWQRWLRTPARWLTASLATSLAAWLGSLPLTAYYFHLLSPVTLLANLVIVPLSSFALACNLASLLCGDLLPWATELFNYSAWWWMACMVKLSNWSTLLPGAFLYVRGPTVLDFVIYYCVLVAMLSGWLLAPKRRGWALAGLSVLAVVYFGDWYGMGQSVKLSVIPSNGGMAIYTDARAAKNDVLIDCGTTNSVEFITKPFLHAQGVNRLPAFALTHGDLHHIGGAEMVTELFSPKQVCVSPIRFRSPTYRRIMQEFNRRPDKVRKVSRGDHVGPWTVLHPEAGERFSQADDNALVLLATFQGTRVLLLSDLGRSGQEALLERMPDLRADIVVTGLPTATEALRDELLDAVQPRLIIVADSEFPASERASAKLCNRLGQRKIPVIYTRAAGAATLEFRGARWELRSINGIKIQSPRPG